MRRLHVSRADATFLAAVAVATILAAWLRTHGITQQVVIDDEWHAIHKLLSSSYAEIFAAFGVADHSIPLTLMYKAMADTVGLAEGRLRFLQVACGIASVPVAAWLARRATGDAPAAALLAFLVAGAPFLVMWSRFARPYAITLLLCVLCVAAIWRWRAERTGRMAAYAAITAALSAWLHPITGMYAAIACVFVFLEDAAAPAGVRPRPSWSSLGLGAAVALAMALPLALPIYSDRDSLAAKAGGDRPDLEAMDRLLAIIWGGIPTPAVAIACVFALWGVVLVWRRDSRLVLYLVALGVGPGALLWLSGAVWMHSGQNFLRYQLPLEPLVLFFGSVGMIGALRGVLRRRAEAAAWVGTAAISAAYLAATPTIEQVATLGVWYGYPEYHWDYRHRWLQDMHGDRTLAPPPAFYAKLARFAPGSTGIIEAPFIWEGFFNKYGYYATFHRQRETFGMLHDLCLDGPVVGEIPANDPRFRFRRFVFLQDRREVLRNGSRYLLLHRQPPLHVGPRYDDARCLEQLARLYGKPVDIDERLAVFDLRPWDGPPKTR